MANVHLLVFQIRSAHHASLLRCRESERCGRRSRSLLYMKYQLHISPNSHKARIPELVARVETIQKRRVIVGLDIHSERYVVVAQYDRSTPGPALRFAPAEFMPWIAMLLHENHSVFVVYEACGFGFGLYRALTAAGATCHVRRASTARRTWKASENGRVRRQHALSAS
jgi:transposase